MAGGERRPRATRLSRATPELLKGLRHLRVALCHPKDDDGEMLTRQLQRIGCRVEAFWPPPDPLPDGIDVVFCAVRPESASAGLGWIRSESAPTVVAVIDYENPTVVDAALKLGARGALAAPLRSTGVLSTLVTAMSVHEELREARKRVERLERKLDSANQIGEAKAILVRTRGIGGDEAYRLLREQAMARRVPVEQIARAVIQANDILALGSPPARP
jgi:AmiR/NasT family two-component response regulator